MLQTLGVNLKRAQVRTVYQKAAFDLIRNLICGDVSKNLNKETHFFKSQNQGEYSVKDGVFHM